MSTPKIPRNVQKAAEGLLYMKHNTPVYKIERLLKRTIGDDGRVYFEVEWEGGEITYEPRNTLIKDVRGMVQQYERSHNGTRKQRRNHRKSRKNRRVYS